VPSSLAFSSSSSFAVFATRSSTGSGAGGRTSAPRSSPLRASHKLALLLLGSLATELLFAIALGLFARAFGAHIDLTELLVINISVSLLASFIPVPGGIGVAEFGLTIGLTSAGMVPEAAIAAVLLYRISTYYLPPAWGFPAMLWLQRNRYL
jgi:uncharacterized protein (TIRG00374 family)